jgi:uncharacterized heparinase superfamily protein
VSVAGLGRLSRTVTKLRPAQAGQRVRLRAQRAALERGMPLAARWLLAGPDPAAPAGWPAGFTPLDALLWRDERTGQELRTGKLTLLGASRVIAADGADGAGRWAGADWQAADEPLLWRFHLHYWDWAWALASEPRASEPRASEPRASEPRASEPPGTDARTVFDAIWRSWRAAVAPGGGPAWHPYPASLRAWSFCGIYRDLVQGGPAEAAFAASLSAHAGFLRRNLETDVGGNHLIKNMKALIGLAVFFGDDALLGGTLRRLRRQIAIQVLPDGGHYERAPAYHCQVLGDLIDIAELLRLAGHGTPAGLPEAIAAMRRWLGRVLSPRGEVPLLNDGFPVPAELLAALAPGPVPDGQLHLLPGTGLARATAGGWHVLADFGPPCPRDLPAHAHADTLGCVVHLDAVPLLIDTGTSSYEPGPVRAYQRSTAAHNTVELDDGDSTEVWGAFRAGRRARVRAASAVAADGTVTIEAAHDGYRNLPGRPVHHRRWSVDPREMRVDDTVSGRGRHRVTVHWHLAPGTVVRLVKRGAVISTAAGDVGVTVYASSELTVEAGTAQVSTGFGQTVAAPVLVCRLYTELPVRISTVWRSIS